MSIAPSKLPASSAVGYRRHEPERTARYRTVESTLPRFAAALRAGDVSVPRFVEREFRDYLARGRLEHGFVRVKCDGCRHEHQEYPQDDIAAGYVAIFAAYLGYFDAAQGACGTALQIAPEVPGVLAAVWWVLAKSGRIAQARQAAGAVLAAALPRAPEPSSAPLFLELDKEQFALDPLQDAKREGCAWLYPVRLDPRLEALRTNERFRALFA